MASQKDMLEIMGGHVFIFAHFLVPKSKLISYHFSFVEGCLQGCHYLLELSKESPVCPCFLISSQTRQNVHLHKHLNAKQGSVPKTNQQSQDSFVLFFFFWIIAFPISYQFNQHTLSQGNYTCSRRCVSKQNSKFVSARIRWILQLTWEKNISLNSPRNPLQIKTKITGKMVLLPKYILYFFEHETTSYYALKCSFWHWGEAHMFWFSSQSREKISWVFFGPTEGDYDLFKCVW